MSCLSCFRCFSLWQLPARLVKLTMIPGERLQSNPSTLKCHTKAVTFGRTRAMRRRTSARRIPVQQLEDGADILHAPTDKQSGSEEVSHTTFHKHWPTVAKCPSRCLLSSLLRCSDVHNVNIYDGKALKHLKPSQSLAPTSNMSCKTVITNTTFNTSSCGHTQHTPDWRPEVCLTCNRLCKSLHQANYERPITAGQK